MRLRTTVKLGSLKELEEDAAGEESTDVDFDEVEISPTIEEKLWVKHRVTVEEVEEALLNPHIEKRKPGNRKRRYIYGRTEAGRYLFMVMEHKFSSWEQEERFWESHSGADYAFEDVPAEEHLRLKPRRTIRRRMREACLKNPFAA